MTSFDKGHALVIGVGEYDEPRLRTPQTGADGVRITVSDAQGVAEALKNPGVCAYPAAQVTFLPDAQTTKQGVTAALQQLAQRVRPDDTVVIFFCGHGSPGDDGEYYFGTRDVRLTDSKFRAGTGLSKTELLDLLRAIKSQKLLLIINACFSGNISATLGPKEEETDVLGAPPDSQLRLQVLGTGEGRAIITASRSTQYSRFDRSQPRTFFGQALVDALNGKGVAGGEYIGLYELYTAVYKSVKAAAARIYCEQEPVLTVVEEVGPFPVALLGSAGGGTLGDEPIQREPPRDTAVEVVPRNQVIASGAGARVAGRDIREGGINIGGGTLHIGGDMVGRDKIVHGDEVHGDKVGGDKISVGNISGSSGVAIGRSPRASVTQGVSGQDLNSLFQTVYRQIDARPEDPNGDKDEIKEKVEKIKAEAVRGEQANPNKIERWLEDLRKMAPDILEVTATTLLNPAADVATTLRKIAEKAKQEASRR